jgi:hypothetical protein
VGGARLAAIHLLASPKGGNPISPAINASPITPSRAQAQSGTRLRRAGWGGCVPGITFVAGVLEATVTVTAGVCKSRFSAAAISWAVAKRSSMLSSVARRIAASV